MTSKRLSASIGSLALLSIFSAVSTSCKKETFNETNTAEIKALVKQLDDTSAFSYRIVLPVIKDNKEVGQEVLGTLSVAEVERIASSKKVSYSPTGNLQIVVATDDGGGPGSHTESCTPCTGKGLDVISRIETVTKNFDKSKYVIIK